ncbi:amino acid ABC transporter permease [Actinosynnema sp. NPDC047251]|uniref:ABC-type glutamate transporter, permease subunit n=1 Tax=Saccharothrix espanaensis (strain ATCC 51144 / DSM 44229 / JCM 9112 / NBRC 15066 / NRRL 15764) TaxID=1179773 RepID=K0JPP2_SACES|nr:amino acid ABC transporter permease [Saccharothrix espanaensis]CCH29035.1 ABC-type glutamate transporter, permease subunit [Saccharothrix espanaensis DSM 44229]
MSSVLFDVPGPRARVRHRLLAVVGVLGVAALIAFIAYRFYDSGQFEPRLWEWLQYENVQLELLKRLGNTLSAFGAGAVLALLLGAVLAAGRLSDHAVWRVPATFLVEIFRAIPLLILIFMFYYGAASFGFKPTPFMAVVAGLTLYNGSVLAEIFRAGVRSLPKGQAEAAYALGMRKTQVMVFVLLPQALRVMLPTIVSQLVVLLKDTALGFIITYQELLDYVKYLGAQGQFGRPLVPMTLFVGAMYITMCLLLTWLASWLEKRNRRNKKAVKPAQDAEPLVRADA